jgi:formylglycine-generating enzyme required for sulfatase activity
MGKYEISRNQILKANAGGGLGITLEDMRVYGANGANRPATGVSWFEAAQFVNYLNTSQGFSPAYKFNSGAFRLWNQSDAGYDPINRFRNTLAKYVLPSRDEWHKAAYGSPSGVWYQYPTASNEAPVPEQDSTSGAVYNTSGIPGTGPSDVNLAGALSAWGTMAQGGNVREWRETAFDGVNDSAGEYITWSGGAWTDGTETLVRFYSSWPVGINEWPHNENPAIGFRVAMIPEPSSFTLVLAGGAVLMAGRRRKG